MGREWKYQYHIFQQAWNCYLKLINIDYEDIFSCPSCKDQPSVIILDGIAMGTTKLLPDAPNHIDPEQKFPIIPIAERIFIEHIQSRKMLQQYAELGIANASFDKMLADLKFPEFANYLTYSSKINSSLRIVDPRFPGVTQVIKILARSEAITVLFRLSALSGTERKIISELSLGQSANVNCLTEVHKKIYGLDILINSIPPSIDSHSGKITLQLNVAQLLHGILKKINYLIKHPSRKLVEENSNSSADFFSYFPALKKNYLIPKYEGNYDEDMHRCTKIYPKHRRFSPGLLVMICQHENCYGFEIMSSRESTIMIYNMLLRKFKEPPKVIIYDNACNLCTTCLIRDPGLFNKTTFLIDRFHNSNHVCNPYFSMRTYNTDEIEDINSQSCEQLFSSLRRISTQVAYMRFDNIFFTTRYFLASWNMKKKCII